MPTCLIVLAKSDEASQIHLMAFGVRQDKVQISVEINGKQVKNTISDLNKSYKQLNREIQQLTPGTAEFNKKAKELAKVKTCRLTANSDHLSY